MICLTLTGHSMLENEEILKKSGEYADLFELRTDFLDLSDNSEIEKASLFPSFTDKPVILTCRRKCDGGKCTLSESCRLDILKRIAKGKFKYIDIEKDFHNQEFETQLVKSGIRIIRSYHNTECLPQDYESVFSQLINVGEIPKIAVQVNGISDLLILFKIKNKFQSIRDKIIVGMGETGVPSRILYKLTGSMLMYCSENSIAPGIVDPYRMKNLFRAEKITDSTKIFGVIGNPVIHSYSPQIHNAGFAKTDLDAVYVPFTVDDVSSFFKLAELLNIQGFSVTAPYKRDVIPYLQGLSNQCKFIGACNTVIRKDGNWYGFNTDYTAASDLFKGSRAVVIGAGGASKAVVKSLMANGIDVTVFNRTLSKAEALASEAGCSCDKMENLCKYSSKTDLVIKAVSSGEDIASSYKFNGKETVCDLFYNPEMTPFLLRAEKAGCKIITGFDFLLAQGKAQFALFANTPLP